MRDAKCYYDQWRSSTPLQRIQIRPKLPDDLNERRFQRTEQRGVQMLLKSIPSAEQQELVTDRALSSTAFLYKLMVRFQPGGAGEKQILLKQLTSMPKTSTIQEVAASIRNWRRHFGRAEEVQAVLPDGILLLKALDEPLQKIASMDQQAAFRLSQSRMQLQLDECPDHRSLWSFSQCFLAEAETLSLLQTAPSTASTNSFEAEADAGRFKTFLYYNFTWRQSQSWHDGQALQVLHLALGMQSWQELQVAALVGRCGGQVVTVLDLRRQRSQEERVQAQNSRQKTG